MAMAVAAALDAIQFHEIVGYIAGDDTIMCAIRSVDDTITVSYTHLDVYKRQAYIRNMFTQDFALNRISIRGEVSNCKYHTSGHIYFTLKDGGAQIAAVMFAGQRKGLDFELREGQEVTVSGLSLIHI